MLAKIEEHSVFYQESNKSASSGSLLFIHGSGGDHSKWNDQMSLLPDGFRGISIDMPGHSSSPGPALESIEDCALLISKLVKKLDLPHPRILVGHSMGAAICLSAAVKHSTSIDGIILIGGGARMKVLPSALQAFKEGKKDSTLIRMGFSPQTAARVVEKELASFENVPAAILYNDFNACNNFDISSDLDKIKIPALIIVGEDDKLTPLKYSQSLHDKIISSQILILAQAGHYLMLEKSSELSQAISEFVARL